MSRRNKGDGAIFYSETLRRWIVRVVVNGRRYNGSVKGVKLPKPPQAARELLISLRAKAAYGPTEDAAESKTVVQVVKDYIRQQKAKGKLSATTLVRYNGIVESKLIQTFGDLEVTKLTRNQVREFYAKELEKTEPTTVLKTHNLLSAALDDAIEDDLPGLVKNVCNGLRPDGKGQEGQAFTEQERNAILAFAKSSNSRDTALLTVAFETGLRSGELLGLTWDAINFDDERLTVYQALVNIGGPPTLAPPKGGKFREVPLSIAALAALRSQAELLLSEGHPRPLVFPKVDGKPMNRNHVRKRFKTLCKGAGVRILDFRATRRTFGSILKKRGVDLFLISRLMGHSSVTTTEKHYVKVEFETLKKALQAAS